MNLKVFPQNLEFDDPPSPPHPLSPTIRYKRVLLVDPATKFD